MAESRLESLLRFYEEDPGDAFTRFAIAREYLNRGEEQTALSFYEDLVRDIPSYVGTYYHLGKLYEKLNRKAEALEVYKAGVKVALEQRETHLLAELRNALMAAQGMEYDEDAGFD